MEGLISLLLFAAVFYVMMRWGCGAHMVHGRHGNHGGHAGRGPDDKGGRDPVCGMAVPPGKGYSLERAGTTHRFCSRSCLDRFEAQPERYLGKAATEERS